jgi:heme exporter protein D
MSGLMEFLAMGGYAAYVWPAYGLSLLILGGFTVQAVRRLKAARRGLDAAGEEHP